MTDDEARSRRHQLRRPVTMRKPSLTTRPKRGIRVQICMPVLTPLVKSPPPRETMAPEVILHGNSFRRKPWTKPAAAAMRRGLGLSPRVF